MPRECIMKWRRVSCRETKRSRADSFSRRLRDSSNEVVKREDFEVEQRGEEDRASNDDLVSITDAVFYHGLIPRVDTDPLLNEKGDFLLRKTEQSPGEMALVLSVRAGGNLVKHFAINRDTASGMFYFEHQHKKTVSDLISWLLSTKTPLTVKNGVIIKRSVERSAWLLNHDSIALISKLGKGAFGDIFLAEYKNGQNGQEVALKTIQSDAKREERLKFMKEARLMRMFNHQNIVKFLGVSVHECPLLLVMEFCPNGSLVDYLRKNKGKTDLTEKLRSSAETSDGLAHLESKKCIHRNISAGNCLLSAKNEIKIADFGKAEDREIVKDDKEQKVLKWLAPETLQEKIYTLKTDIWSYGILVWEISKTLRDLIEQPGQ